MTCRYVSRVLSGVASTSYEQVLENHHCAMAFKIMSQSEPSLLSRMSPCE
jgi:hypothetical protein